MSAEITVILDGARTSFRYDDTSQSLIEAAAAVGVSLPHQCEAGICATCRARLVEGTVTMQQNLILDERELEQGYVLVCQSRPSTDRIVLDFDVE